MAERGLIVGYDHPRAGPVRTIGSPIEIDGHDPPLRRPPLQGEHTDRVAAEVGYDRIGEVTDG